MPVILLDFLPYLYLRRKICLKRTLLEKVMYYVYTLFLGIHFFALSSPQRERQEVYYNVFTGNNMQHATVSLPGKKLKAINN